MDIFLCAKELSNIYLYLDNYKKRKIMYLDI